MRTTEKYNAQLAVTEFIVEAIMSDLLDSSPEIPTYVETFLTFMREGLCQAALNSLHGEMTCDFENTFMGTNFGVTIRGILEVSFRQADCLAIEGEIRSYLRKQGITR